MQPDHELIKLVQDQVSMRLGAHGALCYARRVKKHGMSNCL